MKYVVCVFGKNMFDLTAISYHHSYESAYKACMMGGVIRSVDQYLNALYRNEVRKKYMSEVK